MGKFKIPETPPTVNKTVHFPSNVVEKVEQAIQGKELYFFWFCDRGCSCRIGGTGK